MWMAVQDVWAIQPSSGRFLKGLKQAALDGKQQARYVLGAMFDSPRRTEAERAAGRKLVIGAAEAGEPMAQIALAAKYESGRQVPRDPAEARRWYARAATQGNIIAIDHLRILGEVH